MSHLIAEKTGQTYTSYLRRIRIEKAREFLQNANLSITEVANLSGYNDVSLFIQVFKKEVGLTPNKYKQIAVNPTGRE